MKHRYIKSLTEEEIRTLEYGYKNGDKHYFRLKCQCILLSHEGKKIGELADFANKTPRTIRNWFDSYEKDGIEKLVIEDGRGIKAVLDSLTDEDVEVIKEEIKKNYQNLKAVCAHLSKRFGFEISKWMLIRFLKKN